MTGKELKERWLASMAQVRLLLVDAGGGRLVAMAGQYGTSNAVFACFYPPHVWRRYHNDNHEKRA